MTQPLPHSGAASLKNPRLKEFKGGSTSHYPSSSTKLIAAFEQVICGCCSYKEKHGNRGAPFEMPSSADCSRKNSNSASISDGLLAKNVMYTSSHLTCMQATGNSVELTSPNGDPGPSQRHATLHHKSLLIARDGKVLPELLNTVPRYCTLLDCIILFTRSSFILTVVCGFTPTIPIKSLTSYD